MSETTTPVFTQRMHMHLNGGPHYSELHYDVLRDGKPTEIKHLRRTNGSPTYLITDDVLTCGDDFFDLKKTKGVGMQEWLEAHSTASDT